MQMLRHYLINELKEENCICSQKDFKSVEIKSACASMVRELVKF